VKYTLAVKWGIIPSQKSGRPVHPITRPMNGDLQETTAIVCPKYFVALLYKEWLTEWKTRRFVDSEARIAYQQSS